jgi:lambda family phage portal protein
MKLIESTIAAISPAWAYRRSQFRQAMAAYEAATPGRLRKHGADNSSGDAVVGKAGAALRGYARQLEQNYDIAKGVLDVLVNNTIGPNGITREPLPRRKDGTIHEEFAIVLLALWQDYVRRPEVTWEHDYPCAERLAARTWFRDGELLVQFLQGSVVGLDHGTMVPFSFEMIEADQLPFDYDDEKKGITQGVERNAWGRARAYHVYKQHPGDLSSRWNLTTKRVSADNMLHPKMASRIKQARGVSVFASVMRRLEDLKDYEESERIAARVAAALTGYIKKGQSENYSPPDGGGENRSIGMKPGMIFDDLREGEDVGTIDSNRPSSLLTPFHDAMLRFTATGTGAGYSSISRNYNGTYSAQRQELVEGWIHYQSISNLWIAQFSRPTWERFVQMCVASGAAPVPDDLDLSTITSADFRGPAMPWIDPEKEAKANRLLERCGYKAAQQIIRERNGNPKDVMDQIARWRRDASANQLQFESNPADDKGNTSEAQAKTEAATLSDEEEEETEDANEKS